MSRQIQVRQQHTNKFVFSISATDVSRQISIRCNRIHHHSVIRNFSCSPSSPIALCGSNSINIVYILSSSICFNDRVDLLLYNFRTNSSPYLQVIGGSLFTNLSAMFDFLLLK